MGSNLNPLGELKTLGRQIEQATDLASLKPIFERVGEIATENPHDFEVQLTVGDLKQQVVNRGNRIKEIQKTAPAAPPGAPPLPGGPPQAGPPPLPPTAKAPPPPASSALPQTVILPPRRPAESSPATPASPAAPAIPAAPPKPSTAPPAASAPPAAPPSAPAAPPSAPAGPPQLPSDLKPPRLMSSGQFNKPSGLPDAPAGAPPIPPNAAPPAPSAAPPQPPPAKAPPSPVIPKAVAPPTPPRAPVIPPAPSTPPTRQATPPMPPAPPLTPSAPPPVPPTAGKSPTGPFATTENVPPTIPPGMSSPLGAPPQTPQQPPPQQPAPQMRATLPQQPGGPSTSQQPPRSPVAWKRALLLGALAGSILSILLIVFLVNQARKRNMNLGGGGTAGATVALAVTTTPSGAAVRIASAANAAETNCTADCKVTLAPGNYQVTATLDGYEPAVSAVTVATGQPASVALTLQAQPQSVRILSDLDQGKVTLDNLPPADLQEGQLILDNVTPGPHSVKVAGRSGDASFTFELAAGKAPAITGPVTARNLVAMLVSSFGTQAHIVTNSGPMKLAVNGQPQADAGPAGVDVNNFQAGVDELVLGDAKDQRNMKENFGPAPMLTAFLKSDLNIGTLIVATSEDDVRVFLNDKEYRRKTQRGQVRIPTIGKVTVRVAKDGFQNDPPQVAEVKKGAEVRLEFKMQPLQQMSVLQIRGAAAAVEVLIDGKNVGATGDDGAFTYSTVAPGDHSIELRRDQFQPKRLQRPFRAGQTTTLSGADVLLGANTAIIKLARTPADATVLYRRADETQNHEVRGNQIELAPGSYIITARAPGYAEHTQRVQVAVGETRTVEVALTREKAAPVVAQTAGITDFADPNAWKQQNGLWVHAGAGFVPYKLKPNGIFTFTVELLKGGNIFRGGRIRWGVQYTDAKNYDLFELDKKSFWSKVIVKGKTLERPKVEHPEDKEKSFTVQIEVTPEHLVHKLLSDGKWITLDTWTEPGRDFTDGKFGFVIQGNDEIGISDFKFAPK